MPEYGRESVENVCNSVDIVQVVGEHVRLEKRGKSFFGLCPFHAEKTPSFNVNQEKQMYYCFGCQAGGNVLSFLMEHNKLSFPEALENLAERAGITLPTLHSDAPDVLARRQARERDLKVMAWAADVFHRQLLNDSLGREARDYLRQRGLSSELIISLKLGYGLPGWNTLLERGGAERIAEADLLRMGLAVQGEKGLYDRFRQRVMFPIRNRQGQVIAFGGRLLSESKESAGPKYMNSPETPLFSKGRELYGLDRAVKAISQAGFAIVVEGYMDAVTLWQHGIDNVVATLGTALSPDHAQILRRYTPLISLCFDADTAGQNAALRGIEVLEGKGLAVRVACLAEGKDPDEFLRKLGREEFLAAVGNDALPATLYRILRLSKLHDRNTPHSLGAFGAEAAKVLAGVSNALERDAYVKHVVRQYKLPEAAFLVELGKATGHRPADKLSKTRHNIADPGGAKAATPGWVKAARILLGILAKHEELRQSVFDTWARMGFIDEKYRHLATWLAREIGPSEDPMHLAHELASELKSELAAALTAENLEGNALGVANECFVKIEEHTLTQEIARVKEALADAEGETRGALAAQLADLQRRRKVPQREKVSQLRGYRT
ncbi:MAG: DNA primase [Firmicutes bacterium]|nr:DNA primase [Bacillota bacterium]